MTDTFWTEAKVHELEELAGQGYSCAEIAGRLDCTKNAVISKLKRGRRAKRVPITILLTEDEVAYLDQMTAAASGQRPKIVASIVRAVIEDDRAAEGRA